jgi:WD40 repeat protein
MSITPPATPLPEIEFSPWELVSALAWSPDNELLAVSAGERVYVYDAYTLTLLHKIEVGAWAGSLDFRPPSPDSIHQYALALAAKDGTVQYWDAGNGAHICTLEAHIKSATSVDFSPDTLTLVSAGNDAFVRLWDVANLSGACEKPPLAEMIGGAFVVPAVRFSPDGEIIASVDIHAVRLRDVATQRLISTLRGEASIFSIDFSPDGTLLAVGEIENTIRLWNIDSGETVQVFKLGDNPNAFIWAVAFSPDGHMLAAGSSDGSVTLWDTTSGQIINTISTHTDAVTSVAFSPNGRSLASGSLDATVRFIDISSESE